MVALGRPASFDICKRLDPTDSWCTNCSLRPRHARPSLFYLDRCSIQGKFNIAFKLIPVESKQSLQIGILEKLAVRFVAILVPASALAVLVVVRLASQSDTTGLRERAYSVAVPEKRALSTPLQGCRRPIASVTCSSTIHFHRIFLDPVAQRQQLV